eukprot:CAMPEP_0113523904 /NCGR_PEP_ID=MMETSP0014_2-20120614/45940_1 /TAXON_ID=2857 /ORGANISM="Nitzschia sp." /LENGTH=741 /DNA_ID=CAMNT_0000421997 /DNA_START=348 /DNA_END=2573 /DNA_ORIENTATION=- /assembly_acc=CAM_ASM_000159
MSPRQTRRSPSSNNMFIVAAAVAATVALAGTGTTRDYCYDNFYAAVDAFQPGRQHCPRNHQRRQCPSSNSISASRTQKHFSLQASTTTFYDDFEDFDGMIGGGGQESSEAAAGDSETSSSSSSTNGFSDDDMYAALRRRQDSLLSGGGGGGGTDKKQRRDPLKNRNMNASQNNSKTGGGGGGNGIKDKSLGNLIRDTSGTMADDDDDEDEYERLLYNWREANCISTVRLTLPDWIRRIAVDDRLYPLVVCGSATGNLYLADLEEGEELDSLDSVHPAQVVRGPMQDDRDIQEALTKLFGKYDGGGVLSIAMKNDLIVSSGRDGGIHACTITGEDAEVRVGRRGRTERQTKLRLLRQGKLRGLEGGNVDDDEVAATSSSSSSSSAPLVTSLAFDKQGTLWAAGYDGVIRGYDHEEIDVDGRPLMLRQKHPEYEVDIGSPIVSMTINDELGCGVVSTTTKGVVVFSLDDGSELGHWDPYEYSQREEFARSALIVETENDEYDDDAGGSQPVVFGTPSAGGSDDQKAPRWTLVVGGSKGSLHQRGISVDPRTGIVDEDRPFVEVFGMTAKAAFETIRIQGDLTIGGEVADDDVDDSVDSTLDIPGAPQKIRPNHLGPVVDLASPAPGLFVSGSHDGTMRVWSLGGVIKPDAEDDDDDSETGNLIADVMKKLDQKNIRKPKVLYALSGYKVWLGSIFANSRKLVSDGADNSIIVHSFDESEEDVIRSREEDDEDDLDADSDLAYD